MNSGRLWVLSPLSSFHEPDATGTEREWNIEPCDVQNCYMPRLCTCLIAVPSSFQPIGSGKQKHEHFLESGSVTGTNYRAKHKAERSGSSHQARWLKQPSFTSRTNFGMSYRYPYLADIRTGQKCPALPFIAYPTMSGVRGVLFEKRHLMQQMFSDMQMR